MADRINFSQPINDSTQIGDVLYFSNVNAVGETTDGPTEIGLITDIGNNFVEVGGEINGVVQTAVTPTGFTAVDIEGGALPPLFMFRKNNQANISTLVGYFARVDISSGVSGKTELHSVGSEIFVSSK
tara:strand:- start:2247 stop:2630 length:384 start_codon:yes stop_codon:yes gene_type:complete